MRSDCRQDNLTVRSLRIKAETPCSDGDEGGAGAQGWAFAYDGGVDRAGLNARPEHLANRWRV
jgi:hypothetical protein